MAVKRKSERQRLIEQLDALVSRKVRDRDGWRCVRCGSKNNLGAAHILPKGRYPRLRFEEYNLVTLCWLPCHEGFWHKSPVDALIWLEQKYPGRYHRLQEMAATAAKPDVKALIAAYEDEKE